MSWNRPVERVVKLLSDNEYALCGPRLVVGAVEFVFPEVLVGTGHASDLVIVADTLEDSSGSHLRRSISALARALDMVESRRSLTVIIIGPHPSDIVLRDLSRVCRVLLLGTPTGPSADALVRDALSVLLPLHLPAGGVAPSSPLEVVRGQVVIDDLESVDLYLSAAVSGPLAVEDALKARLTQSVSEDK
ncbi:conserved protein of unknown function [Agreia sp. COWG]|nr:conserved protein of unknown function [Agreia sp. COWG]